MNTEKQRIAIAKACGWTVINGYLCHVTPDKNNELVIATIAPLPDYLNDLNAMHEAEKSLSHGEGYYERGGWGFYRKALAEVCDEQNPIDATASQRAEAFLRTIGKWEADK